MSTSQPSPPKSPSAEDPLDQRLVKRCGEVDPHDLNHLIERFGLHLSWHDLHDELPGSYWGAPEAGLVGLSVHIRQDTPMHSLLHEAGHVICMDPARRAVLHTEAGGEDVEENSVCYLQILLGDHISGVGRQRMMLDMDRWGYNFRLGSTRAWFEEDADDALQWLQEHRLIDALEQIQWRLRGG